MQSHLNIKIVVIVFTVWASLHSYVLLVIVEHPIEFESILKLIIRRYERLRYLLLETQMLRHLPDGSILHTRILRLTVV